MKKKSKTQAKESVTIDKLAGMVAAGFQHVDARINGLESKLNTVHSDVLSMNFDHKKLKARLENVEVRVFGSVQEA